MERTVNTDLPFIAIRQDVEGSDYAPTMGEYLCNPLAEDMSDVDVSIGGFYSAEGVGVIESLPNQKPRFAVPAGAAIRFTLSTWDEYLEMVCHWTVLYRLSNGPVQTQKFGTFKALADAPYFEDVTCLRGPGRVVPGEG